MKISQLLMRDFSFLFPSVYASECSVGWRLLLNRRYFLQRPQTSKFFPSVSRRCYPSCKMEGRFSPPGSAFQFISWIPIYSSLLALQSLTTRSPQHSCSLHQSTTRSSKHYSSLQILISHTSTQPFSLSIAGEFVTIATSWNT